MVGYNSDRTQQCHMSHHFIIIIYINLGRSYSVGSMPGLAMRCKKIQVSLVELISSRPPVGSIFSGSIFSWREFNAKDRLFVTTPRTHRAAPSMRNVLSTTNIIDRLQHNVIALALLSLRPWHCTTHTSSHCCNNPLKTSRGKCLRHRPASVSLKPQISGIFPVK